MWVLQRANRRTGSAAGARQLTTHQKWQCPILDPVCRLLHYPLVPYCLSLCPASGGWQREALYASPAEGGRYAPLRYLQGPGARLHEASEPYNDCDMAAAPAVPPPAAAALGRRCLHCLRRSACLLPPEECIQHKLEDLSAFSTEARHGCQWRCSAAAAEQSCGEAALRSPPAQRQWRLSSRQPSSRSSRSSSRRASNSRAARRGRPRPSRQRARTFRGETSRLAA